jgi:hypothetical protein
MFSVTREPKFNDFTEVTKYIAKSSEVMQQTVEDYANWLLTSTPENDHSKGQYYTDDPKSLVNILVDGDWAEPQTVPNLPDGIYVSLFSTAISILWKKELASVVKIPHDAKFLSTPVCEDEKMFGDNRWCDGDGNAYFLFHWTTDWFKKPWDDEIPGKLMDLKGVDKLGDYRLSVENVVRASENAASLNNGNPYYEWDVEKVMDHFEKDANNMNQFSAFNFPFCDVGNSDPLDKDECDGEVRNDIPYLLVLGSKIDSDIQCQVIWAMRTCFSDAQIAKEGFSSLNFQDECDLRDCKICLGGTIMTSGC